MKEDNMKKKILVKSPAKINLFLDILKKRSDGYHDVNMVMQTVTLFDTITLSKTLENTISINILGNKLLATETSQKENTAYRAATEFFDYTGISDIGLKIDITKNIPVCAGLAGGSTDAAGTLVGLNQLFNTNLTKTELEKLGEKIGADVPFCISGGTALATGIGTTLTRLPNIPDCYFVLCKPNLNISTPRAYEASDKMVHKEKSLVPILDAINSCNLKNLTNETFNSFEDVLQLEEVEKIKLILKQNGALTACMSGSGPTVYGIFNDNNLAFYCSTILKSTYNDVFVCSPENAGNQVVPFL